MSRPKWFTPLMTAIVAGGCGDSAVGPDGPHGGAGSGPAVQIIEEQVDLYVLGATTTLSVSPAGDVTGPLTWSSTDPEVASVSSSGLVTAVSNGAARISVETNGGRRDEVDVRVDAASWIAIGAGEDFACGLVPDGRAFCWGENSSGQAGNGSDLGTVPEPSPVSGGLTFTAIDSGEDHTCGVTLDREVYCWGQNRLGELGVGDDRQESRVPVPIASDLAFTTVSAGLLSSCAIDTEGQAHCWGDNRAGQLGDGTLVERRAPVAVSGELRFKVIDVGAIHTCGLSTTNAAYCWGWNPVGGLGTGDTIATMAPVRVEGSRSYDDIGAGLGFTCALEETGDVLCWGLNDEGQLGSETGDCLQDVPAACSLSAIQVPLAAAEEISAGGLEFACAVTGEGLHCWGQGRTEPIRIGSAGMAFETVAAGFDHTFGIDGAGHLYTWDPMDLADPSGPTITRVPDRRIHQGP